MYFLSFTLKEKKEHDRGESYFVCSNIHLDDFKSLFLSNKLVWVVIHDLLYGSASMAIIEIKIKSLFISIEWVICFVYIINQIHEVFNEFKKWFFVYNSKNLPEGVCYNMYVQNWINLKENPQTKLIQTET